MAAIFLNCYYAQ